MDPQSDLRQESNSALCGASGFGFNGCRTDVEASRATQAIPRRGFGITFFCALTCEGVRRGPGVADKREDKVMVDIRVPTRGESEPEARGGKWFKQQGDSVAVDEPLVELETDKVTLEVPAPAAGVLADIAVKDGATVAVGALLGQIKEDAGAAPKA